MGSGWAARAVAAATITAAMELCLVVLALPAAASSIGGIAALCSDTVALMAAPAAGLAAVGYAWDRFGPRLALPEPVTTLTFLTGSLAAALALGMLKGLADAGGEEFPATVAMIHAAARFAVVAVVAVMALLLVRPAAVWLTKRAPNLGRPRAVTVFAAAGAAVVAMAVSHLGLFAVHAPSLAAWAGLMALAAVTVAVRIGWPRVSLRGGRVGLVGLGILALLPLAPWQSSHARYVLFAHCPTAGRVAMVLRDAVDRDGDGSAPSWLGGSDCAEGDVSRGPLRRELPGDGIDQDCRGGDAPALPLQRPARPLPGCEAREGMSVLLVTFDALRADAFDERITPSLVALARGAVVFARACSPSAHTKPVMASIFASRPVADVMPADGRYENGLTVGTTLAQHMAAASRHTAAFNTFILDPETQAGFADYNAMNADAYPHGVHRDLSSASFTNGALAFVSNPRAEPFFVWVHYPDAHAPYLGPGPEGPNLASQRRAYHRTVAYVDRQLGRLLGGMQHLGLLDRTIVVVASDHGEELGRRGREGHGANVFEESIHVPLVLAAPGCGPLVVEQPVSLAGLGPSLGALMGIPIPGVGLLDSDLPVVAETPYDGELRRAVVRPHAKLIHDVRNGGRMLFDLAHDAGEVHNIYGSSSALTEQLEADYQRWLDRPGGR